MEKTYGAQRLEAACRRGISIGAASYRSIASLTRQIQAPLSADASQTGSLP
jgi:hypothetical protein